MLASPSPINNYPNIFGIQKNLSVESLAKTLPQTDLLKSADTFSLSTAGAMMQQLLNTEISGTESAENAELDMTGLAQLKQRGDMMASMLKMKMKNFDSTLVNTIRNNGMQPPQEMNLKQGQEGLDLLGDIPNKESIENLMKNGSPLQNSFQDISQISSVLSMLDQLGPGIGKKPSAAFQYAQQTLPQQSPSLDGGKDFAIKVVTATAESGMDAEN